MMENMTTIGNAAKFGRGGTILRAPRGTSLTDDTIMARCPSVFADGRHESRSEKYTFIPTKDILGGLRNEGFFPVEVKQGGSKDLNKRGFTKHLVRLQREEWMRGMKQVGDTVPEVLLLNSHDGTSSYVLGLGLLRLACLNGLVVNQGDHVGLKVHHRGDVMGEVINAAYSVVNEAESTLPMIEDMTKVQLDDNEQRAFGQAAAGLRFDEDANVRPEQVLRPHRSGDAGNDLWRVFNRAQENLLRGGITYTQANSKGKLKTRHARQVNSIDGDLRLNRALWTLATEMQRIKAAA